MYSKYLLERVKNFIDLYGASVAKSINNTGLYFPAVIAQAAMESGYGDNIPKDSFNFAGIKYNPNLQGVVGYVESDTTEYVGGKKVYVKQKFSKFKDAEAGFNAHVQVLLKDRYKDARLNATSPEEQLLMIAQAGYTTTPAKEYADSMKSIVAAARDYSKLGRIGSATPPPSSKDYILAPHF
jgi:flagellum-specific peptidoglycan hydrolase FlgJ